MVLINSEAKKYFPLESAGRRIIKNVPLAFPEETVLEVKNRLFEKAGELETLDYIYVIDKEKKLIGVFSIKELFQKPDKAIIQDFMVKEIIKVRPHTDQERVALLVLKNNIKAVPVVDKDNIFLGAVTSDIILEILHSEHSEDILQSVGIRQAGNQVSEILNLPAGILAKIRLPWLVFGLLGGTLVAKLITFFETPLRTHFVLAAFIPLIAYMAGAVGTQTQTLYVRNLALAEFSSKNYFFKEIKVSLIIAFFLAILLFFISFVFANLPYISLVLGISLFLASVSAVLIGILIPWALYKLNKDPALGSGPFVTVVADITSLVIYFSIISLLL